MNKRFTKLIAALALLVGLTIPMGMWGQTTVTFTAGTDTGENSVTKDGVTVSMSTMSRTDNYRCYANSDMSVASTVGNITSVVVTCTANGTASYGPGNFSVSESNPGIYTYESNGHTGTWSGNAASMALHASAQVRMTQIVVTVGGSAPATFTVNLSQTTGGTISANPTTATEGTTITLTATPAEGYNFDSWNITPNTVEINNNQFTMPASDVTVSAQWTENTTPGGDEQWVLTNLADLTSSDVFVIVGNNGSNYAMTNNNGTSSAPAASAVTVENDMITSSVANTIQWTISGNATDGYTFYPNGDNEKWLYCTNANNGVRVGTNESKTFEIKDGYLYHKGTSRYVGLYTANGATAPQDWRCYTSINSNITGQSFAFYKKVDANMPVVSADNLELAYNATTGTINYEITNMVEGGVLSVTNTADWITDVVYTTSASGTITFDVAENPNATSRSTDMLLQYVYGDNQMVNATVTVTQTGNPNITMTIAEVRTQGTGNVYTSGIVTSCVGTTGYIQDETAAICVYGSSLTVGDNITVQGSLTTYNGLLEIANPVVNVISSGNTIEAEVMTIAEINASTNQGWYVRIEEATVTAINDKNVTIEQDENNVVVRFASADDITFEVNDVVSLDGNIGAFNGVQIANPQNVEVQAAPVVPSINITDAPIEVAAEGGEGILTVQYENITEIVAEVYFCDAEGTEATYDWIIAEIDADNNVEWLVEPNEGEARTAYFKVYALDDETNDVYSNLVTVNQAAYVTPVTGNNYELFSGNLVEGDYLIVYNGKAMNNIVDNDRLQYIEVTPNNNVIVTEDAAVIWHIAPAGDYWTIYSANASAYAASTGAKNKAQMLDDGTDDKALWTVSGTETYEFVNKKNTANNVNANLRNNGTYGFACYATGTGGALSLYKRNNNYTPALAITGYGEGSGNWYLVASPVTTTPEAAGMITDDGTDPENLSYDLYSFDQAQDLEWRNYRDQAFNLVPGTGYLYANKNDVTLTFAGEAYTGDGIVPLTYENGKDFAGWNLIGNPFAVEATLDHDFYALNNDGSGLGDLIASTAGTVNAMQGVFVLAQYNEETGEAEETVTFSTENNAKAVEQVVMNVTRNRGAAIDRAIVRFDEGDQLPKFQLNPNNTKLYIAQGNKDYAVVRSAAQGEMPVSFRAAENGTYTLSIETENVEMDYLHLIDNMTGMDVDLLQTPSYTFEAKTSDYASRFRLVFSANGIDEQNAETFAFFNGSEWMVSNLGEATLQVVDVMGRVLSTETISGNAELSLDQPAGVYMLRLINGNDVKVQKVVVR